MNLDEPNFERGRLLVGQGRFAEAEKHLALAISVQPGFAVAHSLMALCLIGLRKLDKALQFAVAGVGMGPDIAFGHYILAKTFLSMDQYAKALNAIDEAIRLDPTDSHYYGLKAATLHDMQLYDGSLRAANEGLTHDPEDTLCLNIRAMALTQLGRHKEAGETLNGSLAKNPDDDTSHAAMGWNSLHLNKHKEALEHFKEALRLDPTSEYAKRGMVEAMKAKYLAYRLMLRYFLWMESLSSKAQWIFVIGLLIGVRVLRKFFTATGHPELAILLIGLYLSFFAMVWLAQPLFNFVLLFNKYGRYALSKMQKSGAITFGIMLSSGLAAIGAYVACKKYSPLILGAVILAMLFPITKCFSSAEGGTRKKWIAWTYAAAMGLAGLAGTIMFAAGIQAATTVLIAFAIAWIIFTWIAAAL